jgi:F0F1-type ATP synthase membrane subunit b/b'
MDETLRALGGVLLRAIPTFLLVVFLHFYLKSMFFGPLKKVLKERYDATEGARKMADSSLAKAAEKAAEYEAALRAARAETYKELEQLRRQLQDERAAGVREARSRADAAIAEAKASLNAEMSALKRNLETESEALAGRIAAKILRRPAA